MIPVTFALLYNDLHQINSCTVKKVLGPTTDFQTWGSCKETENPQRIWLWRPVGFDYKTYTGLGKQTLGGYQQNFVCTRTQEKGIVTPKETDPDLLKSKTAVWGSLTNSCEKKRSKGEKERYTHLNAEFQRIARKDKKAFFSDQCKEIEESNRMGKTRDLFKKIRHAKEHFMQRWAR